MSKWRSVNHPPSLPDGGQSIHFWVWKPGTGEVFKGEASINLIHAGTVHFRDNRTGRLIDGVTHYMPIEAPEPPGGESKTNAQMTEARARAILGETVQADGSLAPFRNKIDIEWKLGADTFYIHDGCGLSVDTLEAAAWWIRNKK